MALCLRTVVLPRKRSPDRPRAASALRHAHELQASGASGYSGAPRYIQDRRLPGVFVPVGGRFTCTGPAVDRFVIRTPTGTLWHESFVGAPLFVHGRRNWRASLHLALLCMIMPFFRESLGPSRVYCCSHARLNHALAPHGVGVLHPHSSSTSGLRCSFAIPPNGSPRRRGTLRRHRSCFRSPRLLIPIPSSPLHAAPGIWTLVFVFDNPALYTRPEAPLWRSAVLLSTSRHRMYMDSSACDCGCGCVHRVADPHAAGPSHSIASRPT
ncbi:hypothetical protein C8R45DRAFT_548855 [Mycena sanguinolenta]|nr:hypothetical protein C8R45DRAFT_548855 [Mycena sanguinolenta]